MTNRPICPKGQRKPDSPCIFCQDGSYCAHQYYCPGTRRYENSGWRECRRMKGPAGDEGTIPSQPAADSPFAKGALPAAAEPTGEQEVNKEVKFVQENKEEVKKEVKSSGAKKSNRRKPRKS